MIMIHRIGAAVVLCAALCETAAAQSFLVRVEAKADIYRAGETRPAGKNFGQGLIPPSVTLPAGTQCVTFGKATGNQTCAASAGCITIDNNEPEGTHYNDPDGVGAYPSSSSNLGRRAISGIAAPYAGYLTGLFTPAGGPKGPAPAPLDFTKGKRTAFTLLAPALDQTFFVGDGRNGDGTGITQKFSVPATAATLYLGISDAPSFSGAPGAYLDNVGIFRIIVHARPKACRG